jgi:hypothetical protein
MQYGCLWSPVQCNYFHPFGWLSSIFHTTIVLEDLYGISMLLRSGPIEWFPSLSMTLIDVPHKNSARSLEWIDTIYRCFWGAVHLNYFHPCGWLSSIFHKKISARRSFWRVDAIWLFLESIPIQLFLSTLMTLIQIAEKVSARILNWCVG